MRALVARLVNPFVWRIPRNGARKLFNFSLAEHGSMLDLFAAARMTASYDRKVAYLRHALDERRHAQMFATRSAELRRKDNLEVLGFPNADTEQLFENLGEVAFLAFVHRGEKRGREQFEMYRDWFASQNDNRARAFFDGIIRDEQRHEDYTRALLAELAGGEKVARKELRRAAAWEAWRTWRRVGKSAADAAYFLLMVSLYPLLAPFSAIAAITRPSRTCWVLPSAELEFEHHPVDINSKAALANG